MSDMPKIYLETTIFNFYFDDDRGVMHAATRKLFGEIAEGRFEAYASYAVIEELEDAPPEKARRMLGIVNRESISVLLRSAEAERLADEYVPLGIIPAKKYDDALHIALAAVNGLDIIVSLNFQHIVKNKTINMTAQVNAQNGHKAISIYSPMEVVDYED